MKLFSILTIFGLLFSLLFYKDVFAQTSTKLAVNPAAGDTAINSNVTISLLVTNGVNIAGFDVTITYDPSIVQYVSYSYGGYLDSPSKVYLDPKPGIFRLVATQVAKPDVSGDGNLLNLVFNGNTIGISPITLTRVEFADSQGVSTFPEVQSGSILVHSDPASVPSRTVTGSFSLQGQTNASGIPVTFSLGETHLLGPYTGLTSAGSPNLSLPNVAEDTYRVTISLPRYLNVHEGLSKGFIVSSTSTVMPPLMLYGGNAVWRTWVDGAWQPDNIINAADVSLVGAQYLQSGPDLDGDVNYSGRVDIFDLAMVGANYGLTSKDVYATWLSVH